MAGVIQAFTGWLRGKIEADSQEERDSIANQQAKFIGAPKPGWMWRQAVGGPPASKVQLRKTIAWKGSELLAQYNPGAVYIFPRISWDIIRRSFRRTDGPNVFDDGQPNLVWTAKDNEVASCISRMSDYWEGRGCGYNPGEKIQLSAGTWPYWCGQQVTSWSGIWQPDMAANYMALHTPSAIHVQTPALLVQQTWGRWRGLVLDKLPVLPSEGQSDPGIYQTADKRVYIEGDKKQHFYFTINGIKYSAPGEAIAYVTDCFQGFFAMREAVLRDWQYLSPKVQEAGKSSPDPVVKARAMGGAYKPPQSKPAEKPAHKPGTGSGGGGGGLLVLGAGVAAAALLWRR